MNCGARLPYGHQLVDDEDVTAVAAVLRSDFLTTGDAVSAFEGALKDYLGCGFVASCSSGTAALHLALLALDLKPGSAVVVPSVTFMATASTVRHVGCEVVFADVDPGSGLMTERTLREALDRALESGLIPAALFPVHLNGQCVDMEMVADHATKGDLRIVEDASHAIGGRHGSEGTAIGSCKYSDMAVFSFHPVKTITMGEGGAVTGNRDVFSEKVERLRNHGIEKNPENFVNRSLGFDKSGAPNPWYHEMSELGFNYRASDLHCALGLSQLRKLDRFVSKRSELVDRYDKGLKHLAPVVQQLQRVSWSQPAWHLYVVLIDFGAAGVERSEVMRRLSSLGVGSQVHYLPVHKQPYFQSRYGDQDLTGADEYYARALSLPLFPGMPDDAIDRVVAALGEALA